jgi:hypothetical protein
MGEALVPLESSVLAFNASVPATVAIMAVLAACGPLRQVFYSPSTGPGQ